MQLLGFDVDPVNSVHFSNHTGYPKVAGQRLDGDDLWTVVEAMEENGLLAGYTHILTGYIGTESFLRTVLRVIRRVQKYSPDVKVVVDPVMGDYDLLRRPYTYVPDELLPVFQNEVLPLADIMTPNQLEAERLTGRKIVTEQDALAACDVLHASGVGTVVITSCRYRDSKELTLVCSQRQRGESTRYRIVLPMLEIHATGTGDLTTALLAAWMFLLPDDVGAACENAVNTVQAVLQRTMARKRAGRIPEARQSRATAAERATRMHALELQLVQSKRDIERPPRTFPATRI